MSLILLKLLSILCVYIVDYAFATVLITESTTTTTTTELKLISITQY